MLDSQEVKQGIGYSLVMTECHECGDLIVHTRPGTKIGLLYTPAKIKQQDCDPSLGDYLHWLTVIDLTKIGLIKPRI